MTSIMNLFDEEEIIRSYIRSERYEAAQEATQEAIQEATRKAAIETAERMIKGGEMSLEEIADYIPSLSLDELKELEAEVMRLAQSK